MVVLGRAAKEPGRTNSGSALNAALGGDAVLATGNPFSILLPNFAGAGEKARYVQGISV